MLISPALSSSDSIRQDTQKGDVPPGKEEHASADNQHVFSLLDDAVVVSRTDSVHDVSKEERESRKGGPCNRCGGVANYEIELVRAVSVREQDLPEGYLILLLRGVVA